MQLDACPIGSEVEVISLGVPGVAQLRLREVGVRVGATVRVTNVAPFGGRVVAIGASRVAVDGATAAVIGVTAGIAAPVPVPALLP
jgi:ferrous iron transport protein A